MKTIPIKRFKHILVFFVFSITVKGQDPQFSQFYANALYLAPSFAGSTGGSRVSAQYRNQWWDLGIKFVSHSFFYDHYFESFNSGVGLNFVSDIAGSSKLGVIQFGIHYSYDLVLYNVWHLRPGINFSYLQQGIFGDILFVDELLHPGRNTAAPAQSLESAKAIDACSSVLLYTEGFWIGCTVDHLLTPNISSHSGDADVPYKISAYGGIDIRRNRRLLKPSDDVFTISFLYKQQELIRQLDIGAYWFSFPFILGTWYRGIPTVSSHRGEAVVLLAGLKVSNFNFGYSYDITISNLIAHTKGSHEISITYKFLIPDRNKKGAVPCPEL